MIWHSSDINSVLNELEVNADKGLSNGVAENRLKKYGKNVIKNIKKPSIFEMFLLQLKDKHVYILSAISILSFIFSIIYDKGDIYSPLLIILIVLLNALISAYQMYKSDLAINNLRSITNPIARVLRDGIEKEIYAEDLVPGDIILIKGGDYIPADARLIETNSFSCNEYILTGEDIPSNKKADDIYDEITDVSYRTNMVYSGTTAIYGTAKAVVVETGLFTEIGHNSSLNQQSGNDTLPITSRLNSSSKLINIAILIICTVVFAIQVLINFKNYGFATTTITALLNSMALAVSAIPEGLPAISTIAIALGIERIIHEEIIIKKVRALEVLGKTTVICSDKTGIITKNTMSLNRLFDGENIIKIDDEPLSENSKNILRFASCCSTIENDSTESSINNACIEHCGISSEELDNLFPRVGLLPFDSVRKTTASIILIDGKPYAVVKGATENLADKFNNIDKKLLLEVNEQFAKDALRIVCVGIKQLEEIPSNPSSEEIECNLTFVGLIGLEDPLREQTINAIKATEFAGIRTIMITGDNLTTAYAVARRSGILKDGFEAITGAQLAEIDDEELIKNIGKYSVFARVNPDDKLRIISALQQNGEIVTITGDDFKDIRALANADIGCAMGKLGTDVIRANADIIIKNSHFDSIVNAIKESRGLFANIQKSVAFLLSCNLAEIAFYLISLIVFKKPPISAVQLLWINLLTDCSPVIALATLKAEDTVMNNHPLALSGRIFDNKTLINTILQASYITFIAFVSFVIGNKTRDYNLALTMSFFTLGLSETLHTFNIKTTTSIFKSKFKFNDFLFISTMLMMFIIFFLVLTPAGAVFGLKVLPFKNLMMSVTLSLSLLVFCEILKLINKIFSR
ncbi:MAG: cation-translocating P-type ATPase [Clostridia bacterium]|nr:cation-translocating P-type ATPase [Clostridia bacterium]